MAEIEPQMNTDKSHGLKMKETDMKREDAKVGGRTDHGITA